MSKRGVSLGLALLLLSAFSASARTLAGRPQLTFEQRVAAQEAIERVYYAHQVGATRPFEAAVPREALEERVRSYLVKSAALEAYWATPVSADALQAELERIASQTRFPERLEQVYAALGHDVILIQETFARATLVDRLARSFFRSDERIQGDARQRAELLRTQMARGEIDVTAKAPGRTVFDAIRTAPGSAVPEHAPLRPDATMNRVGVSAAPERHDLAADEFDALRSRLPETSREPGAIIDEPDAYIVPVVVEEARDRIRVAHYRVEKRRWEDWLEDVQASLDANAVPTVASDEAWVARRASAGNATFDATCSPDHRWDNGSLAAVPEPRTDHSAVWTGNMMIIWGGRDAAYDKLRSGWRYDPLTDTWSPMSTLGAPRERLGYGMVWAGDQMLVWGGDIGYYEGPYLGDGARYDPVTDAWTPMSMVDAPEPRSGHEMVWTGTSVVVWGGRGSDDFVQFKPLATGAQYDPATDRWTPMSTLGAPGARDVATAVWMDPYVVVWGGLDWPWHVALNTGGRYDPVHDVWLPVSTAGAPSARLYHTAVPGGRFMVVWGGEEYDWDPLNDGGRYDPRDDYWEPIRTDTAPTQVAYSVTWTGEEMVVWGGADLDTWQRVSSGSRYNPLTDVWTPTQTVNAPSPRTGHTAVWTGSLMVVWGGGTTFTVNTGGRYDPGSDTWTPTSTGSGPAPRENHRAVWTGSLMLIWGGDAEGAKYDPLVDAWTPIASAGAPPTSRALAVWTGQEMIVWRNFSDVGSAGRGGCYDPVLDRWRSIDTVGAPPRQDATAVWTGETLIVWGGGAGVPTGLGARYNPEADSWQPLSTVGAPSSRYGQSAVWTGREMIIWGGVVGSLNLDTGARYDPATDSWTRTSTVGAPAGREEHTAIWTGDRMIIWGGHIRLPPFHLSNGGLYDPVTDSWQPLSMLDAPSRRGAHTAVWTGGLMLVWGGRGVELTPTGWKELLNSGGIYNPQADAWIPTPRDGAPEGRERHSAVWTGEAMIVWGGNLQGALSGAGGRYLPGNILDTDQDGYRGCDGDCDDSSAGINPAAIDLPGNAIDEDCDGVRSCDPAGPWRNHGHFVRCVAQECGRLAAAGAVSQDRCAALVSGAARAKTVERLGRPGPPTEP